MNLMKYLCIVDTACIEIQEKPVPVPQDAQVQVKVKACSLCGTDLQIYHGNFATHYPYSPGHEYSGVIRAKGRDVKNLNIGDRVVINPNFHCGACFYCGIGLPHFCENMKKAGIKSNGGFAEYTTVSEQLVYTIPGSLSFEEATLIEPLSCALRGIETAKIAEDDLVVIIGGGAMGLLTLLVLRTHYGNQVIISEPSAHKRQVASQLGADAVCDPLLERLGDVVTRFKPTAAEVVIDYVGSSRTLKNGYESLRKKGKLIIGGLSSDTDSMPISPIDVVTHEIEIAGTFLNPGTFPRAIEILSAPDFDGTPLLSHSCSMEEMKVVFEKGNSQENIKSTMVLQ
jgi:threonine dehydrogenase-like Zn-dependent dehydrogenase